MPDSRLHRPWFGRRPLWAILAVIACGPRVHIEGGAGGGTEGSSGGSGTSTAPEPVDPQRWFGRYHYHSSFVELGRRTWGIGGGAPNFANLEIRPDGRAVQSYDVCTIGVETRTYRWRQRGPQLVLEPEEGDTSLMWLGLELDEVVLELGPTCNELTSRVVVAMSVIDTTWNRGAVCRRVECAEPLLEVVLDYCEGEGPTECP